ncbi:hypothetical protein [Flavobacterium chungnamense]|uniref:DNA primase n=1 Tax=Flavobacterium chungnamense TaxID=706182 RepID=A0ABP7UEN9_9FLAO
MENSKDKKQDSGPNEAKEQLNSFPDYPQYPEKEDIYNKFDKESDIDPEDITLNKSVIEIDNTNEFNSKDFDEDQTGEDLDIPGSELDDHLENIGSEDEENNYYSIGGDNHNDLEENKEE